MPPLATLLLALTACANDNLVIFDSSKGDDAHGDDTVTAGEGWDLDADTGAPSDGGGTGGDGGGTGGDGGGGTGGDGGGGTGGDGGGTGGDGGGGTGGDGGGGTGGDGGGDASPDIGDLVISELMIDATAVPDAQGEYVEVYNDSDRSLQLQGMVLGDEGVDWWQIEEGGMIAPGDYAVICADTRTSDNGGVNCDASFYANTWGDGFALANSGDEVLLMRSDGTTIDRVSYSEGQVEPGVAIGVRPGWVSATDNDSSAAWCPQTSKLGGGDHGTPGRSNDGC